MKKKEVEQKLEDFSNHVLGQCHKEFEDFRNHAHRQYRTNDYLHGTVQSLQAALKQAFHLIEDVGGDLGTSQRVLLSQGNRIDLLETDARRFKCQIETKHRQMQYKSRSLFTVTGGLAWAYFFECTNCGLLVRKTADELTMKDREALIALGLLEV